MRCDRCGYAVPDWLWIGDDHPIIMQERPAVIRRTDHIEDNTMKVVTETFAKLQMCKDVHPEKVEAQEKLGEMAERLAAKSGLSYRCCIELLDKGWTYKEEVNEPGKWLSPVTRLQEKR